jgi:hypothetical protein
MLRRLFFIFGAGEWREQNENASAREIEDAEFASTVQSLVPYAAPFLLTEADSSALARLYSMPEVGKREMLKACPTFWCEYKLLSAPAPTRRSSKRTTSGIWST